MRRRSLPFNLLISCFLPCLLAAQAPVANFTSDVTFGCAPVIVKFADISTNNPTSWRWDLGNGVISNIKDPQTSYFTPGTYAITLTATNSSGSNTITRTTYLQVYALPFVDFFSKDTVGCYPFTARFSDLSKPNSGVIKDWEWNFGDGRTSIAANPVYTFSTTGTFDIVLKVTNSYGCATTAFKQQYIKAGDSIKADFIPNIQAFCSPPAKVDFINASSVSGNMSYSWKFGDGNTSVAASPIHTYNAYGNFSATLKAVSDGGCSDSITKLIRIEKRSIDFTGPDSLCTGVAGAFSIKSNSRPSAVLWQMGDGVTYTTDTAKHSYKNAGNYNIKLITQVNNCSDTISRFIKVNASPIVDFAANATNSCRAPFTVTFKSNTAIATSWLWSFGDGTTSTEQNPVHVYNSQGKFDVNLTGTSPQGCVVTSSKSGYIKIQTPVITISNLPAGGCLPYTFAPEYVVNSVDSIASYFWDFGNGITSTLSKPSVSYTSVGTYTVKLIFTTVSGCKDSVLVANGISVGEKFVFDFKISPTVVCGKQNVSFNSNVVLPVNSYQWTFGDNEFSALPNPVHRYYDTGYYSVSLTVNKNGCPVTVTKKDSVYVGGTIARFDFTKDCSNRGKVTFRNTSVSALNYRWNFGDSTFSTEQNPVHVYNSAGEYKVVLITGNGSCFDTATAVIPVWFGGVDVTSDRSTLCKGEAAFLILKHPSPDYINLVHWDYGDGQNSVSEAKIVKQAYSTAGTYNLTVTATDVFGCSDTVSKTNFIRVNGPDANIKVDAYKGCTGNGIDFKDLSTTDGVHQISRWQLNFGDGTVRDYQQPPFSHVYNTAGIFSVKMKVTDRSGCSDSIVLADPIIIAEADAGFLSPDSFSCNGNEVAFKDLSKGNIINHLWSFGDGQTTTFPNPIHTYADTGLYTVKLLITAASGCIDSIVKQNYITIKNPLAKFGMMKVGTSCAPLQINFSDSSYYAKSWHWDFGDGKTSSARNPANVFSQAGIYNIKLTVTSFGGCQSVYDSVLNVTGPQGTLTYTPLQACNNVTVSYKVATNGSSDFTWDFNDGTIVSGKDSVITHTYLTEGDFVPKVILKDVSGCAKPIQGTDTIRVQTARPGFTSDVKVLCENAIVNFKDSSASIAGLTYRWDFGDGTFSTDKNPSHRYVAGGKYSVKLAVTTPIACTDSIVYSDYISVIKRPDVSIVSNADGCEKSPITFSPQLIADTSSIVSWMWNFGNGQTSLNKVPPAQQYATPGIYMNTVSVVNSTGCRDTATNTIRIFAVPQITLSADTAICLGDDVPLFVSGATTFNWSPSNNLNCTTCNNPVANPRADQMYKVTGTTDGCTNEDSVKIKVIQPSKVSVYPSAVSLCVGDTIQLQASGTANYLWTPSATLSANNISNPKAYPTGNTTYNVIGYDTLGCFRDTSSVSIMLHQLPTVELGPDLILAAGTTKILSPVFTGSINSYVWTPSQGLSCSTCPNPVVTAFGNTTYRLRVTNNGGCTAEDSFNLIVTCDNSTVFVPNTFSPNGDGMNDVFYPRGNGINRISSMKILNRWGEVVYQKTDLAPNSISDGWDGMYKATKAPVGVYTYAIEIVCNNSQILKFIGNITLIQ